MVVEILHKRATATCVHCGGDIEELADSVGSRGWTHLVDGRFQEHCPGAPVAEPDPAKPIVTTPIRPAPA